MNHREQMRRRRGAGAPRDDSMTAPAPASVKFTIERLVLAGVAPGARYAVAAAVQSELARLLAVQIVPPANFNPAVTARRIDAGSIYIDHGMGVARVGEQIAQAIHGCLSSTTNVGARTERS